jgi:Uma2 family endonuclease
LIISGQNPIQIDEHNEPEPDIALLVPRDDFYAEAHPTAKDVLLVIEVSDSTLEYDRDIKKNIYAEAGISEFWLVNLKKNTIETFWNPTDGDYYEMRIFEQSETIQSRNIEYLTLPVSEILGEDLINSETAED